MQEAKRVSKLNPHLIGTGHSLAEGFHIITCNPHPQHLHCCPAERPAPPVVDRFAAVLSLASGGGGRQWTLLFWGYELNSGVFGCAACLSVKRASIEGMSEEKENRK